ncbi:PREDICTED: uncharacterized protein LOC107603883 [Ficedula albicollis]|uniref:uncharacterized protein LOC107603883 n=1 Tax=Ficedula albicollis TaxID=59894 RepID=UPI0007AD8C15|nr:PREDICTED: uncharacterized protein LOC107603883 [Ficedula albicollis]XP_016156734.1 PREDICTED: uncharacterized protein LOC107603883 [Ficedula albicollis]
MGASESKEIPKVSPLGSVLAHWKELVGYGGTETKKELVKFCTRWWPLYRLEEGVKWPSTGTFDYETLLQLMLFLRREQKWQEVTYADTFFTLQKHPEWQWDCGIRPPSGPFVLTLEKDYKANRGKLKRCCSACSIDQRCIHPDKVYQTEASPPTPEPREPNRLYPPLPPSDSEEEEPSPQGPIASRTQKQTREVLQAPLMEAVTPKGTIMLIRVPFSTQDLEAWEKIAKRYQSDPTGVARRLRFMIKQHNPDWDDMQLLLDALTETEKQMVLKVARDLAEDVCRRTQEHIKDVLPLQDPGWDRKSEGLGRLRRYQELIVKGLERAIPRPSLYAIKQGPSQTPTEFLDQLREAMRLHTTLDPQSDEGTPYLVNLFVGQSTGDIRRELQKIRSPASWDLETLLDEAWRVFSSREERYRQGMRQLVRVREEEKGKRGQGPPRLGKDQCAFCKEFGHWKNQCPERRRDDKQRRGDREGERWLLM